MGNTPRKLTPQEIKDLEDKDNEEVGPDLTSGMLDQIDREREAGEDRD